MMIFRSLSAFILMTGALVSGQADAQILLCPEPPSVSTDVDSRVAESRRLLKRLTIALDLYGQPWIDEQVILDGHVETPSALLAKLGNVADQCAVKSIDLKTFHEAQPGLRRAFLEAVGLIDATEDGEAVHEAKTVSRNDTKAEDIERVIDLSVRALWRKLWFRPAKAGDQDGDRWAVIVASPKDADRGWDELGEHQRRWNDAYFQLHRPYYEKNPHHAIIVGRRLSRDQAERLRDYAINLGMAEDAFIWVLPKGQETEAPSAPESSSRHLVQDPVVTRPAVRKAKPGIERNRLDLSILKR